MVTIELYGVARLRLPGARTPHRRGRTPPGFDPLGSGRRGRVTSSGSTSAEMLRAVTGLSFQATDLVGAAGRISLVRRLLNEREGWTPAEDTLPARFFEVYHLRRGLDEHGYVPEEAVRNLNFLFEGKTTS